jgi:acyl-CoA synthetase (AMP-forming)/AMP-acid ligase II
MTFYAFQVAMYIGEMCRYIMATAPKPDDTNHCIRLMLGNGMRPTIWKDFIERFKIGQVAEFYGSTEGNTNIGKLFFPENFCYIFKRQGAKNLSNPSLPILSPT